MAFAVVSEELNCSICLNVYSDPVMLSCGHNFCCACIGNVLDTQQASKVFFCPQCRMEFKERPALPMNITLRNIVEHFLSPISQEDTGGILCTYCINSSVPAIKTCVNCEASLCDGHIKVHQRFKEHMLIEPTACLEDRKCNVHNKILEYYCSEDSVCICVSCGLDGTHKGHQVSLINETFKEKRRTLSHDFEFLLQKRAELENEVESLLHHKNNVERCASVIKEKVNYMFLEIQKKLDTVKETVLAEISRQETEVSNSVAVLIQQLKTKLGELSTSISNSEKLLLTTDPFSFLRDQGADRGRGAIITKGNQENTPGTSNKDSSDDNLKKEIIYITLIEGFSNIVNQIGVDQDDLLLDPDTAGNYLNISRDLRMASWAEPVNCYPQAPMRFVNNQVLSKENYTSGCHYWNVETGNTGAFRFGIAYPSIDRKKNCLIGDNNKSWSLRRFNKKYFVMHDKKEISLPYTPANQNLGVYLDYEAGRLSFYELGDKIIHLHTFTTTFTEPLHAAFLVFENYVKIKGATNSMISLVND